ncbi:MAG TPA: hypothetical protein VGV69_04180 [Solirubrobacterales bacterium]|nr:hypothetical protein [Solirubrobacterales bacterium]
MIARTRRLLSFSNVIACLALFIALGGTVYAAGKINGKQIKRSSLPGNRIKPKTIQPNRIKPKSLTGRQVKANALTGTQINEKTLTGVSAAALAEVQYQSTTTTLPGEGRIGTATANCPPDTYVIGGGATLSNDNQASVNSSGPGPLLTGWRATAYSYSWFGSGSTMTVTAICVRVEKPRGAVDSVRYESAG